MSKTKTPDYWSEVHKIKGDFIFEGDRPITITIINNDVLDIDQKAKGGSGCNSDRIVSSGIDVAYSKITNDLYMGKNVRCINRYDFNGD
jgi:hypothetical protein